MMGLIVLGVGDYGATAKADDTIRTYALGSCVGVVMVDTVSQIAGMIHVALPDSAINPGKAKTQPGYFADTGILMLLKDMQKCGYRDRGSSLIVKIAGGANILDPNDTFSIGKRNVLAIKKILRGLGMGVVAEDVGGNLSRTVSVTPTTDRLEIISPGRGKWEI
jgi:chemotaxis protein CheD